MCVAAPAPDRQQEQEQEEVEEEQAGSEEDSDDDDDDSGGDDESGSEEGEEGEGEGGGESGGDDGAGGVRLAAAAMAVGVGSFSDPENVQVNGWMGGGGRMVGGGGRSPAYPKLITAKLNQPHHDTTRPRPNTHAAPQGLAHYLEHMLFMGSTKVIYFHLYMYLYFYIFFINILGDLFMRVCMCMYAHTHMTFHEGLDT
jgi:hypothetical protein